jgi:hypothetical protein
LKAPARAGAFRFSSKRRVGNSAHRSRPFPPHRWAKLPTLRRINAQPRPFDLNPKLSYLPARKQGRRPPRHRQTAPRAGDWLMSAHRSDLFRIWRDKLPRTHVGAPSRGLAIARIVTGFGVFGLILRNCGARCLTRPACSHTWTHPQGPGFVRGFAVGSQEHLTGDLRGPIPLAPLAGFVETCGQGL